MKVVFDLLIAEIFRETIYFIIWYLFFILM